MGARVFLSYSSRDQAAADAVCKALEAAGIRCWLAPRDLAAGSQWGAGIVEAIEQCEAVVVVFSAHANNSPQVAREMELAVSHRKPLVPVRIRDELPTADMQYFLGVSHWFNAFPEPIEHHLPEIVAAVRRVLDKQAPGPWTEINRRLSALTGGKVDPKLLLGGGAVLLLLLLLLIIRDPGDRATAGSYPPTMVPSELVGRWQAVLKDDRGKSDSCQLDISESGTAQFSQGCPLPYAGSQGPVSAVKGGTWAQSNYKPGDDGTFLLQSAAANLAAAYKVAGDSLVTRDDKFGEVSWTKTAASAPLETGSGGLPALSNRVAWPLASMPELTRKTTAYLREKWQPDAVPMSIKVTLSEQAGSPSADGTVARDMVGVQYEYYSPATQQGAGVMLGGPNPIFPLGTIDRDPGQALPDNFIDLPEAVRNVRNLGMRANVPSEAQLQVWTPGTAYGSARLGGLQWMIDSAFNERYVAAASAE